MVVPLYAVNIAASRHVEHVASGSGNLCRLTFVGGGHFLKMHKGSMFLSAPVSTFAFNLLIFDLVLYLNLQKLQNVCLSYTIVQSSGKTFNQNVCLAYHLGSGLAHLCDCYEPSWFLIIVLNVFSLLSILVLCVV